MSRRLEFFFDFRSPYSYLAYSQLGDLGAEVVVRPMDVLKVMEVVNNTPTTLTCAVKGRYARKDLGRWAQRYGVPVNPSPESRANDAGLCARAVLAAGSPAQAAAVTEALFRAFWGEARTLKTAAEVLSAIEAAGLDAAPIAARLDDPDVVATLEANTKEAAERGVFGAPTIFVGDEMFFGNDRLEFVRECLAAKEMA
jgi:2-hydroxychromene-2-carboxylate isomerase